MIAPKTNPTPVPIANVNLSPSTQTVVISLNQSPSFKVSIIDNGQNSIAFPCSVTIKSSLQIYGASTYLSYIQPRNYGTYDFDVWIPNPSQATTVSYYAVIQDSNGNTARSNTVTVDFK